MKTCGNTQVARGHTHNYYSPWTWWRAVAWWVKTQPQLTQLCVVDPDSLSTNSAQICWIMDRDGSGPE